MLAAAFAAMFSTGLATLATKLAILLALATTATSTAPSAPATAVAVCTIGGPVLAGLLAALGLIELVGMPLGHRHVVRRRLAFGSAMLGRAFLGGIGGSAAIRAVRPAILASIFAASATPAAPATPAATIVVATFVAAIATPIVAALLAHPLAVAIRFGVWRRGIAVGLVGRRRVVAGARQFLGGAMVLAALTHALDLDVGGVQLLVGLDRDGEAVALLDVGERVPLLV